jgi:hypothetical protein
MSRSCREREFTGETAGRLSGALGTQVPWPDPETKYTVIAKCYVEDEELGRYVSFPACSTTRLHIHIKTRRPRSAESL